MPLCQVAERKNLQRLFAENLSSGSEVGNLCSSGQDLNYSFFENNHTNQKYCVHVYTAAK